MATAGSQFRFFGGEGGDGGGVKLYALRGGEGGGGGMALVGVGGAQRGGAHGFGGGRVISGLSATSVLE